MGQPRSNTARKQPFKSDNKKDKKNASSAPPRRKFHVEPQQQQTDADDNQIDLSHTIPLTLQQLVLNVFKFALLVNDQVSENAKNSPDTKDEDTAAEATAIPAAEEETLDIKGLIQTIKSHLYNRDFDSAFTDASDELLRAYALRWSAARALGYAGLFKSLLKVLLKEFRGSNDPGHNPASKEASHVVCIGGGAGAEIVALAAAWRDLIDEAHEIKKPFEDEKGISDALHIVSLDSGGEETIPPAPGLSITAVDIADWSSVVNRLSDTIQSTAVSGSKVHPAPLYQGRKYIQETNQDDDTAGFVVGFKHLDVLSTSDDHLRELFRFNAASGSCTIMVTLMFTLNELFSTSMAKASAFLLRTTDLLRPGTVLLVVDSPGSYSTLKLGKISKSLEGAEPSATQGRQYPMKFLLDHTLLSVAKGKWERIYTQDSRWWRRDAARLWYDVGDGAGLEDMRFQVHVYRRLS